MEHISKEIRRQVLRQWRREFTQSKFAIGFILALILVLSWSIYKSTDRAVTSKDVIGKVLGVHQVQGDTGSTVSILAIQLSSGKTKMVTKPIGVAVKIGEVVKLSMVSTEQGNVQYHFIEYLEEAANEKR